MSMTRVGFSAAASDAERLTAVVVFPTPPFWFAMQMIFAGIVHRSFMKALRTISHLFFIKKGKMRGMIKKPLRFSSLNSRVFHVKQSAPEKGVAYSLVCSALPSCPYPA
jgi:hypothetical protein